jgi:HPt (histidine-containing phosphotransfer) domain-containing protein
VFLADAPAMLETLRSAVAGSDTAAIAAAAHTIKGSAGLFSRGAAFEAARALEHAARRQDRAAIDGGTQAVEQEIDRLVAALRELVARLRATP